MSARRIDMVDLAARHRAVGDDVEARVIEVLRSGRYVGGAPVAQAEAVVARWFGREAAVGVNSGTDALILGLQVLGVGPGHEVIVPALSFFATASAVALVGAVPVVVDVRPDGLIDPDAARAAHTERTGAVIPVHLFGNHAPIVSLPGVPILDDAAQAIGSEPAPSHGQLTALSVYPTKTWGTAGNGGFVLGDPSDIEAVRTLANHGVVDGQHVQICGHVGRNSRLDAIQGAVLLGHAPGLADRVAHRRRIAERYDAHLPDGIQPLPRTQGSAVHQYCVLVEDRDRAIRALDTAEIGWAIYYDRPLHHQPALTGAIAHPTPVADDLCQRLLALPVHDGIQPHDVDRVCQVLERR